jgi:hypothetical protein
LDFQNKSRTLTGEMLNGLHDDFGRAEVVAPVGTHTARDAASDCATPKVQKCALGRALWALPGS